MRIAVNGTTLWFDVEGAALVADGVRMREQPTIVLLHGGPGSFDHSYFKPDFAALAPHAQVVYLDLPGHGRSTWGAPEAWRFESCADDLSAFCESLGIVKPIVLGHSLGGFVALVYAIRHGDQCGALVLQSTHARFDLRRIVEAFRNAGGDAVAHIIERVYGGDSGPVTAEDWSRCWRLFGPWVIGEQEKARTIVNRELNAPGLRLMREFDVVDRLGQIDCPSLVCVGALDPITPVAAAREMFDALPRGRARFEVIEGAGHFPWRDAPDRYWPILTDFVRASATIPR